MRRAMAQALGWAQPARHYLALYDDARGRRRTLPGN
jgi:hypothetical protein